MTTAVFVAPYFLPTTVRFIEAVADLAGVRLGLVSQDPEGKLPPGVRGKIGAHWQVRDALDVEPPAGAGARSTFRVDDDRALAEALGVAPPRPGRRVLLEEFVTGEEHSFDSVWSGGRMLWHSLTRYLPGPLDVLRNPWIQW